MNAIAERAEALAARALSASRQKADARQDRKRQAFQQLKECDPAAAEFMQAVAAAFGKPEKVRIEIGGKVIYDDGRMAHDGCKSVVPFPETKRGAWVRE